MLMTDYMKQVFSIRKFSSQSILYAQPSSQLTTTITLLPIPYTMSPQHPTTNTRIGLWLSQVQEPSNDHFPPQQPAAPPANMITINKLHQTTHTPVLELLRLEKILIRPGRNRRKAIYFDGKRDVAADWTKVEDLLHGMPDGENVGGGGWI